MAYETAPIVLYIWPSNDVAVRHLSSFILIGLVSFQSAGYLILPMVRLGAVRSRAMKHLQEESEAVTLLLAHVEFESGRSGKRELWREGILYDIKSIRREGDSVRVIACPDRHEQVLLQGFRQIFQHSAGTTAGNPLSKLLVQLLTAPFLQTGFAWLLAMPPQTPLRTSFAGPFLPGSRQPDICSPPPETVQIFTESSFF